jgi:hypothetical protein
MNIIRNYSEASFVVYGDTKKWKEALKELGGRYNGNLKNMPPDTNSNGWVFSKKHLEKVEAFLGKVGPAEDSQVETNGEFQTLVYVVKIPQIGQTITIDNDSYIIDYVNENHDQFTFDNGECESRVVNGLWALVNVDERYELMTPIIL